MVELKLEIPKPVEVIDAPDLHARMAREHAELAGLADRARALHAIAVETESHLNAHGFDAEIAEWMLMRLHQQLADWRHEAECQVQALLFAANSSAARIVRGGRGLALSCSGALATRRPRAVVSAPDRPIHWRAEPPSTVPEPIVESFLDSPTAPGDVLVSSTDIAIEVAAEPSPSELSVEDRDFWPHELPRRRRLGGRVSKALVLQALAAMAVLAAVAVRFV